MALHDGRQADANAYDAYKSLIENLEKDEPARIREISWAELDTIIGWLRNNILGALGVPSVAPPFAAQRRNKRIN